MKKFKKIVTVAPVILLSWGARVSAQTTSDATKALTEVQKAVSGMWQYAWAAALSVAALVGIIGAIICYTKWQQGDPNVTKTIAGWAGAVVAIIIMGMVLKTVFV